MRDRRVGVGGGFVFVVLSIVGGLALPKPPDPGASATRIGSYLVEHHHRIELASAAAAIAAVGLLVFVSHLHERLTADPLAARLVLAGGSSLVGVALVGAMVQAIVAQRSERLHGDTLVLAFALDDAIFYAAPSFAVIGLLVGVARGAAASELPSWLGNFGLAIAALGLVGGVGQLTTSSTSFATLGFVGFVLTVAWVAATSVVMMRETVPVGQLSGV